MADIKQDGVTVIGCGLAGSEAVWQLAKRSVPVTLYEMRPYTRTPAHHTDNFAELVCSNSLRANSLTNAVSSPRMPLRMRRVSSLLESFSTVKVGSLDKIIISPG